MFTYKTLLLQLQPLYRTCTLTNLPFATHFHVEHCCFTSHLHQLTTSHGIKLYTFDFAVIILYGFQSRAHKNQVYHQDHDTQTRKCAHKRTPLVLNAMGRVNQSPKQRGSNGRSKWTLIQQKYLQCSVSDE